MVTPCGIKRQRQPKQGILSSAKLARRGSTVKDQQQIAQRGKERRQQEFNGIKREKDIAVESVGTLSETETLPELLPSLADLKHENDSLPPIQEEKDETQPTTVDCSTQTPPFG